MLSSPTGDTNVLFEPAKSLGSAIKILPPERHAPTNLSKDDLRTIAFHNAEQRMLELRLARRYRDPVRANNEAREAVRAKIEEIYARKEPESSPTGKSRGRGSRG